MKRNYQFNTFMKNVLHKKHCTSSISGMGHLSLFFLCFFLFSITSSISLSSVLMRLIFKWSNWIHIGISRRKTSLESKPLNTVLILNQIITLRYFSIIIWGDCNLTILTHEVRFFSQFFSYYLVAEIVKVK